MISVTMMRTNIEEDGGLDMQMDAEERIISAAIMCIEQYGLQGATIRRIAQKAGLNSAAINYYFRSKDRLLEKAVDVSLQNAFDWNDYQVPETSTAQERIEIVLTRLIEGAHAYPGLTRAHFFSAFAEGRYDEPGIKRLNLFLEELLQRIKPVCIGREESSLRLALMQIMSAAFLLPALLPKLFDDFSQCDLFDQVLLHDYIHRAVTRLF